MITKQQIPFVRILLFFLFGIVLADYYRLYDMIDYIIPVTISFGITSIVIKRWSSRKRWVPGALLMVSITGIGYLVYMTHSPVHQVSYIGEQSKQKQYLNLIVKEKPKEGKRLRCITSLKSIINKDNTLANRSGDILLYIDTTDLDRDITIGDKLLVHTKVFPVKSNNNPDVFDFKSYLYYRDVNLQSYISASDIINQEPNKAFSVFFITQQWRETFHKIILQYIHDPKQQGIASAMLLGIKNNVDASLYDSFTNSGAVHVLAVSGLHVGFVAMILYFLLGILPFRSKTFRIIKTILIVLGVFTYGLMTGMAPAIMRATIMYTIFIIANAWKPATNKYNLLAFSAFIMLLYNPFMLFQAGFQFSYLAIWGIMAFYNPIRSLIYTKSRIGSYLTDMVGVSLAAQLLVFPITVYYFHKFPSYFFISGLLAIPAAAVIISLGIGMIMFHFIWPTINDIIIAPLLQTSLDILINGIEWINTWPMASIDGIFINKPMMVLLYAIIGFISLYKLSKKKFFLFYGLIGILFFILVNISHIHSSNDNNDFIVYDSYGSSCIDFFIGDKVYNIHSSDLESKNYKFLTYNHRLKKAIKVSQELDPNKHFQENHIKYQEGFLQVGTKIIYLTDNNTLPHFESIQKLDYLIISGSSSLSISDYLQSFDPNQIIIDHSISNKQIYRWKREARSLKTDIHFIKDDGIFRATL